MEAVETEKKKGLNISVMSFVTALAIIFALMVATYVLTFVIPGGEYQRLEDGAIDPDSFTYVQGGIPFWQWLLSPFLVLGSAGNVALIAVIAFLLVIGGVFNALDKFGLLQYMLEKITAKFAKYKYPLLFIVTFFFMALGSLVGSFEECIPLVPIAVALAISLGWDVYTGIGMSLLAVSCGFSAGICNPFTIGTAQSLAGLPMFSGIWLRLVAFACVYALLSIFLFLHAKRVEKKKSSQAEGERVLSTSIVEFENDKRKNAGLLCFAGILCAGIVAVILSPFVPALSDYTMIIVAVAFLVAGLVGTLVAGMTWKQLGKEFYSGVTAIFPAVLMILMASSIKYTMEEAKILDTALHALSAATVGLPQWVIVLFVYLIILVMNFFIPSGSAKAFMLIPLIAPFATMQGIPMQLCILAFAFGDGFSNVFYPTNPALLISLGLVDVNYIKWVKWSWPFQLLNLMLTCGLLLFGFFVGYC